MHYLRFTFRIMRETFGCTQFFKLGHSLKNHPRNCVLLISARWNTLNWCFWIVDLAVFFVTRVSFILSLSVFLPIASSCCLLQKVSPSLLFTCPWDSLSCAIYLLFWPPFVPIWPTNKCLQFTLLNVCYIQVVEICTVGHLTPLLNSVIKFVKDWENPLGYSKMVLWGRFNFWICLKVNLSPVLACIYGESIPAELYQSKEEQNI